MPKLSFEIGTADINDLQVKKIINAIRGNNRALGYVATGLKQTQDSKSGTSDKSGDFSLLGKTSENKFDYKLAEGASKDDRMAAAGIKAEEELFAYLCKILTQFPSAVLIPSLTMEDIQEQLDEKGYIGDLDFVLIIGKSILIIDSKVLAPSNEVPYSIRNGNIVLATKIVREVHPGQFYVKKWAKEHNFELKKLSEYVIIMNRQETLVYKSPAWHSSIWKLFHVTELYKELEKFYNENNDDSFHLDIISEMYKHHISAEKSFKEEDRMRSLFRI